MQRLLVIIVLFTFFVLTLQRPTDTERANAKILKLKNVLDPNGEYHFEFELSDGTKREEKALDGTEYLEVEGSYLYTDPQGKLFTVHYVADKTGYHIKPFVEPEYKFVEYISPSILGSLVGSGI